MDSHQKRQAVREYRNPRRAMVVKLLLRTYLLIVLVVMVYAAVYTFAGYDEVPYGVEAARIAGQLPVILLDGDEAPSIAEITPRHPLPWAREGASPDRWLLQPAVAERYGIRTATTAPEFPKVTVRNPAGQVVGVGSDRQIHLELEAGVPYIVEVAGASAGHYYTMRVYLPDHQPHPLGLFPLAFMISFAGLMLFWGVVLVLLVVPPPRRR